jgi:nitrite reductase/ring-hydroxylating ferredoxin subunit
METDKHLLTSPALLDLAALPGGPPAGHLLADLAGVATGRAATTKIHHADNRRVSVFIQRLASGTVVAYVNACPHVGVELDLTPGKFLDRTGQQFICSLHGALFDPLTGLCTDGPCKGRFLQAVAIDVDGDKVFTRTATAT